MPRMRPADSPAPGICDDLYMRQGNIGGGSRCVNLLRLESAERPVSYARPISLKPTATRLSALTAGEI